MSDLDKYSYHEVVHTAALAVDFFVWNIEKHPVVSNHKKLNKKAKRITRLLAEFYQAAGVLSDKQFPTHQS
jgi:hypothetical protein